MAKSAHPDLPLVSICIPAYNAERFIAETLESALRQDYPCLEIVVSDDCSTDRTLEIIGGYESQGVRLLRQERNLGMHANWNAVILASRGKYVVKLDADDLLEPPYVSGMVQVMEAHPRVTFSHCACRLIDVDGNFLGYERSLKGSFIRPGLAEWPRYVFGSRAVNIVMLRRSAFDAIGSYDERFRFSGDWKMHRDLLQVGDVFYNDGVLASYRVHSLGKKGLGLIGAREGLLHFQDMERHWPAGLPGKEKLLRRARRRWALTVAQGAATVKNPEQEEVLKYLPLYGAFFGVRLLSLLIRFGGSSLICSYCRNKLWLRHWTKRIIKKINTFQEIYSNSDLFVRKVSNKSKSCGDIE